MTATLEPAPPLLDYGLFHIDQEGKIIVRFHMGQAAAYRTPRRIVAMLAGSQGGKTSFGPWWQWEELKRTGGGDHLIVTANYDLFKLRLLPTLQEVFEETLKIGRYWANDRVFEICEDGEQGGAFLAKKSSEKMWGRLILRSADAPGGLESATAKSAWLDEAGQDSFTLAVWKAIKNRRLALSQGRILITTTLYNLGWLVQHIIKPAEQGGKVKVIRQGNAELTITDNEKADICLVQYDSILNPQFPYAEFEEARATMPEDEFMMFFRGIVAKPATLVYNSFDYEKHTCPPFQIPRDWKILVGLDFGGVNTAAVIFAEEPSTKRLYGVAEYWEGGKTARQHVAELLPLCPRFPYAVYGGAGSEGQWRNEFSAGGLPVQEPKVSDVDLGINIVYGEHKRDNIIYFRTLENLLDQKTRYRRKRDKNGEISTDIENKNSFHLLDAERYLVSSLRGGNQVWSVGMRR